MTEGRERFARQLEDTADNIGNLLGMNWPSCFVALDCAYATQPHGQTKIAGSL
jgi:hypothetical protein